MYICFEMCLSVRVPSDVACNDIKNFIATRSSRSWLLYKWLLEHVVNWICMKEVINCQRTFQRPTASVLARLRKGLHSRFYRQVPAQDEAIRKISLSLQRRYICTWAFLQLSETGYREFTTYFIVFHVRIDVFRVTVRWLITAVVGDDTSSI